MITKQIALSLSYRNELWHTRICNRDGTPLRIRINGKCQTWKTRPTEFRLPCKYGLRDYVQVTQHNAADWALPEKFNNNLYMGE